MSKGLNVTVSSEAPPLGKIKGIGKETEQRIAYPVIGIA